VNDAQQDQPQIFIAIVALAVPAAVLGLNGMPEVATAGVTGIYALD